MRQKARVTNMAGPVLWQKEATFNDSRMKSVALSIATGVMQSRGIRGFCTCCITLHVCAGSAAVQVILITHSLLILSRGFKIDTYRRHVIAKTFLSFLSKTLKCSAVLCTAMSSVWF